MWWGPCAGASGVMKLISSDYPDLHLCVGLCIVLLTFLLNMISLSLAMLDPRHAGKRTKLGLGIGQERLKWALRLPGVLPMRRLPVRWMPQRQQKLWQRKPLLCAIGP